jgi:hypothetical protein
MPDTDYDNFMKMPLSELAKEATMSIHGSRIEIAKLVYHQRMLEIQHENAKQQIELQHSKNMQLLNKQLRWIKFSAILTAVATLTAGIAGALLSYMLTVPKQPDQIRHYTPAIIQPHTKTSTSVPDYERKDDKVP